MKSNFLRTIVLGAFLLMGCLSPESHEAPSGPTAPTAARAFFAAGQGGIEGNVVDESILPIANASVRLLDVAGSAIITETTSGPDGSYALSSIDPGEYRVAASAEGFANRSLIVRVEEGIVANVPLMMSEVAGDDPYASILVRNGVQTCAGRYIVGHLMNLAFIQTVCRNFAVSNFTSLKAEVPLGHRAAVIEFDWQKKHTAGDWAVYAYLDGANKAATVIAAPTHPQSPKFPVVKAVFEPGKAYPRGALVGGGEYPAYPQPSKNFTILAQIIYGGDHVNAIQTALAPYCSTTQCWGVGFEVEWRYTIYGTIFVHEAPAGLANYTALPDR